eukprot:gene6101-8410_t
MDFKAITVSDDEYNNFVGENDNNFCEDVGRNLTRECNKKGLYCRNLGNYTYIVKIVSQTELPVNGGRTMSKTVGTKSVNCKNQTKIDICPAGFYCPTPFKKLHCQPGYFCGIGSVEHNPCQWGRIACAYSGLSYANPGVYIGAFVLLLLNGLMIYNYFATRSIAFYEYKFEEFSHVEQESIATLEQEQKISLNALKQLAQTISVKSLRVDHGDGPFSLIHRVTTDDNVELPHKQQYFEFSTIKKPLYISFDKLCLNLKSANKTPLLVDVFGAIQPFQVTALMGPSGAGKTTLLALLRGQAFYAKCTGTIRVNGATVNSLVDYSSQMAFVPQDDILYEELSVEDNIFYSALLFNKRGLMKAVDILPMVNKAEKLLGIDFIRTSIVGSAVRKGISGGQKKRVSITMEIMKEASLFFLDEPTSGLDSATSISVLNCLHQLSLLGVNIVTTIHQPRQEILDLISTLILLAPGGRIVYFGPPANIKNHFAQFGYHCPMNSNVADFVMDVLAGFMKSSMEDSRKSIKEIIGTLCNWWENSVYQSHVAYMDNELEEIKTHLKAKRPEQDSFDYILNQDDAGSFVEKTSTWEEWLYTFRRTAYVAGSRQKKIFNRTLFFSVIVNSITLVLAGLAVGYLILPVDLKSSTRSSPNIIQQVIVGQLVFGIFAVNTGMNLFGGDELIRSREEGGGLCLVPLFLGKIAASNVEHIFFAYAFLSGYYSVIRSNTSFLHYWGLYMLLHLVFASIAHFLSIVLPAQTRSSGGLAVLIVLWLFGGILTPYPKLAGYLPVIGPVLNALSPFRWSFQAHLLMELESYSEVWDPVKSKVYKRFGIVKENYQLFLVMLVVYCVIVNLMACIALVLRRDNYLVIKKLFKNIKKKFDRFLFDADNADDEEPNKHVQEVSSRFLHVKLQQVELIMKSRCVGCTSV